MRIFCIIILFLVMGCYDSLGSTAPSDTLTFIHETGTVRPLVPDSQVISGFKDNSAYNYYDFQVKESRSLNQLIGQLLQRLFQRMWDVEITSGQANVAFWIIMIVILVVIILLLVVFKPSWFYIDRKKKPDYRVEDESIYGIDFDKLIKEALIASNYTDAIRWRYLQILKKLQDKELIAWDPNKTVNEYVTTFKRSDLKPVFGQLSRLFLYFRYGNFEAGKDQYDEVDHLAGEITQRL